MQEEHTEIRAVVNKINQGPTGKYIIAKFIHSQVWDGEEVSEVTFNLESWISEKETPEEGMVIILDRFLAYRSRDGKIRWRAGKAKPLTPNTT